MIKLIDFEYELTDSLEVKIKFKHKLIRKEAIRAIYKSSTNRHMFKVENFEGDWCNEGFIMDKQGNIVKNLDEVL